MKNLIEITRYEKEPITGFVKMEITYLFGSKRDPQIDLDTYTSEANARAYFFNLASTVFRMNVEWWVQVCEKFQWGFLGGKHQEPGAEKDEALIKCKEISKKYIRATAPLSTEYKKIYSWFIESKLFFERLHPPRNFQYWELMDLYFKAISELADKMHNGDQFDLLSEFMAHRQVSTEQTRA